MVGVVVEVVLVLTGLVVVLLSFTLLFGFVADLSVSSSFIFFSDDFLSSFLFSLTRL